LLFVLAQDCVGCVFDRAEDTLAASLRALLLLVRFWLDIARLLRLFPLLFWHDLPEQEDIVTSHSKQTDHSRSNCLAAELPVMVPCG